MADRPLVDNAAAPSQVREGKRQERLAAEIESDDWRILLSIPAGRRRIWWLLEQCGASRNAFDRDALTMAFRTGEQNIGLKLTAQIERANPTALVDMMREAALERSTPHE